MVVNFLDPFLSHIIGKTVRVLHDSPVLLIIVYSVCLFLHFLFPPLGLFVQVRALIALAHKRYGFPSAFLLFFLLKGQVLGFRFIFSARKGVQVIDASLFFHDALRDLVYLRFERDFHHRVPPPHFFLAFNFFVLVIQVLIPRNALLRIPLAKVYAFINLPADWIDRRVE